MKNICFLVITSIGLLFLYWVSNFLVPDIIVKNFSKEEAAKEPDDVEKDAFYDGLVGGREESTPDLVGILNSKTNLDKDMNTGFGKGSKKQVKGRKRSKSNVLPE